MNRELDKSQIVNQWGPWKFADDLTFTNELGFDIDLSEINSNAEMLEIIFRIYDISLNPGNADLYCIKSLIAAFDDIFEPNYNCNFWGRNILFSGIDLAGEYLDRIRLQRKRRRANLRPSLRFKILHRDQYRCQTCGASAAGGADLHIDHILPVSKGGTNDESNLRALCSECNIGRGNRYDT